MEDKERLSLTGYVYKSLWNRHTTGGRHTESEVETVFADRVMAMRLAISSGWQQHIGKIMQQITVAVAACNSVNNHRQLLRDSLSQLRQCADDSARRAKNSDPWKHLSLFINSLQALYCPEYTTDIQVCTCRHSK